MTDWPRWRTQVRHVPGALGGSWYVDISRQAKRRGRWQKTNTCQGRSLGIALSAAGYGAKQQERNFPELTT
jgi:hypothetical protein